MKFSVFALAALSAATSTSSRYLIAAAASRKGKFTKKGGSLSGSYGATGPTDGPTTYVIPIGDPCMNSDDCAIPLGLVYGVCGWDDNNWFNDVCQSGQPGATCVEPSDCVVPTGLKHGVCRHYYCQSGKSGSSCDQTSDCVPISGLNPPHAVCRNNKCQSGKSGSSCGQTSDCVPIAGLNPPRAVCRNDKCQR